MIDFLQEHWLSIITFTLHGLWVWLWWSLHQHFVSLDTFAAYKADQEKLFAAAEKERTELRHRLDAMEKAVQALPTVTGIHNLNMELEKVRGELQGFRSEMAGQRDFMQRTERQITMLFENELKGTKR